MLLHSISTSFSFLVKGLSNQASAVLHVLGHIFIPFTPLLGLTDKTGCCDGNTPPPSFPVSELPYLGSASQILAEQAVSLQFLRIGLDFSPLGQKSTSTLGL